ncbi:MAG TPA: low temperature requirement protein A [Nocardioides sp.]|nr:low temperature requirement protein A [Nocardioides sp.]
MSESTVRHTAVTMSGRDPHERGRTATPLELLFDLTFVIAFGTAADELAHLLAAGHVGAGIVGFCFATFAVSWAWINFAWFASAYDTDDWVYRITTMVQMVGVIVLALGLPRMFASLEHGDHVDNGVMVLGYVIMRVPMIAQWMRAARQDPDRREVCKIFIVTLTVSQIGWIVLAFADTSVGVMFAWVVVLVLVELVGPFVAEHVRGGTPWHAHHIAERYGLMVIIALGEGLLGTTAALGALIDVSGWTTEVALLGVAGVALTFGLWWTYFVIPCGDLLHAYRSRSFGWGYGHIPLFGAIVAVGAGLHAAAYFLEHHSELSATGTLLTVAIPVSTYLLGLFLLYAALTRTIDPFHLLLIALTGVVVAIAVVLSAAGLSITVTLLVLALAPWVTVVGYEAVGHRHNAEVLAALPEH